MWVGIYIDVISTACHVCCVDIASYFLTYHVIGIRKSKIEHKGLAIVSVDGIQIIPFSLIIQIMQAIPVIEYPKYLNLQIICIRIIPELVQMIQPTPIIKGLAIVSVDGILIIPISLIIQIMQEIPIIEYPKYLNLQIICIRIIPELVQIMRPTPIIQIMPTIETNITIHGNSTRNIWFTYGFHSFKCPKHTPTHSNVLSNIYIYPLLLKLLK